MADEGAKEKVKESREQLDLTDQQERLDVFAITVSHLEFIQIKEGNLKFCYEGIMQDNRYS